MGLPRCTAIHGEAVMPRRFPPPIPSMIFFLNPAL
jgi:hypothetical protein